MSELFIVILAIWFISGIVGLTYLSVVIFAFIIVKLTRKFVINYFELAALIVPILVYLLLIYLVDDRQGFNWGFANLIIALPAIVTVFLGTRSSIAYWIGIIISIGTAVLAWLFIPTQGFTRLF